MWTHGRIVWTSVDEHLSLESQCTISRIAVSLTLNIVHRYPNILSYSAAMCTVVFYILYFNLDINCTHTFLSIQQLRHENLINLIEVFRKKKRLYLVFEFVDHTVLDDLEKFPTGADESYVKKVMWQVLKGVEFCHSHNVSK